MDQWVAGLPRQYPQLAAKPANERRLALVLSGAEDAPAAAAMLDALGQAGYRIGDLPIDAATLADKLRAVPSGTRPHSPPDETLSFADYSACFASLAPSVQQQVVARWGAAERDPLFRPGQLDCGRFAIPGFRRGLVALLLQSGAAPAPDIDSIENEPGPPPPHARIALCIWLADAFRSDVVIDLRHPRANARPVAVRYESP
jgi:cobaltochelatase CobN